MGHQFTSFICLLIFASTLANGNGPAGELAGKTEVSKVVYLVVDTSVPVMHSATFLDVVKVAVKRLVASLPPDAQFAVSSFEGPDTGIGSYLKERAPLTTISEGLYDINEAIDLLDINYSTSTRDVGAALRGAIEEIRSYKDDDGSVLYFVTSIGSDDKSTTWELDIAESVINNRIQLIAVEFGPALNGMAQTCLRLSEMTNAFYYYTETLDSETFFEPINKRVTQIVKSPIETGRRIVTSLRGIIDGAISGPFYIGNTFNLNTMVAYQLNRTDIIYYSLTTISPPYRQVNRTISFSGSRSAKGNDNGKDGNWNSPSTDIGILLQTLNSPTPVGVWKYELYSPRPAPFRFLITSTLNPGASSSAAPQPTSSTVPINCAMSLFLGVLVSLMNRFLDF